MSQEELFEKYISATMTLEDKDELKELLKSDKEAGKKFAEYIQDTALYLSVAEELKLHQRAVDLDNNRRSASANFKVQKAATGRYATVQPEVSKTGSRVILAIAAAFTICGILFFNYLKQSSHVADIASAETISLDRGGWDLTFGDKSYILSGDRITALDDISVSVKDGSQINMSKGSVCEIIQNENGLEIRQTKGRSEYNVAKQTNGKKFRVVTDKIRTTVIGTRFTVDAEADRSKVRVTEGTVKVDDFKDEAEFLNEGEFATVNLEKTLTKKVAYQTMKLANFISSANGEVFNTESIEEKPYIVLLYAESWDPSSRSFIHKLKNFYSLFNKDFEVVFMNDAEGFAKDYDMPWACIDAGKTPEVESLIGKFSSSYPLNMVLMDQHGNVLAKSVKGKEWLGADHVLDVLEGNLNR